LYNKLIPGRYPITVEGEIIKFSIGRKKFGISRTNFMNSSDITMDCIFDLGKEHIQFPLQKGTGNNFYLGKYSEYHIKIDFNDLEIEQVTT
jgi:hypothetical protein